MVKYYFRTYSPKNKEFQTACQLAKVKLLFFVLSEEKFYLLAAVLKNGDWKIQRERVLSESMTWYIAGKLESRQIQRTVDGPVGVARSAIAR
ncbi:hypothetical protein TNCV_4379771 [Trichonephila clavipes]|nr:hypothetical protein TNCV_4379771 [Trichonephila clavipes]